MTAGITQSAVLQKAKLKTVLGRIDKLLQIHPDDDKKWSMEGWFHDIDLCLSVYLSVCVSVSVCLSVSMSACMSVCVCVCVFLIYLLILSRECLVNLL